jgi:hypothetical protein
MSRRYDYTERSVDLIMSYEAGNCRLPIAYKY